jgi:DNA-directed RNA polymerase specialized sigma subunit
MTEDDNNLVFQIQNNENTNACLQELINRHSGIFYDMVNKLVPSQSTVCNKSDLLNERDYHIYNSALKFDPNRGTKFSTFLGNETKWLCLNSYNKEKRRKIDYKTVEEINLVNNLNDESKIDMHLLNEIMFIIDKHPDNRVSKIFRMRYNDGHNFKLLPWKKIAPHVNLSIQGCINVHDSVIKDIKRKLLNK